MGIENIDDENLRSFVEARRKLESFFEDSDKTKLRHDLPDAVSEFFGDHGMETVYEDPEKNQQPMVESADGIAELIATGGETNPEGFISRVKAIRKEKEQSSGQGSSGPTNKQLIRQLESKIDEMEKREARIERKLDQALGNHEDAAAE